MTSNSNNNQILFEEFLKYVNRVLKTSKNSDNIDTVKRQIQDTVGSFNNYVLFLNDVATNADGLIISICN